MNKMCEEEIQLYITRRVGLTIISAYNAFSFTSRYTPLEKVADNVLFPRSLTNEGFENQSGLTHKHWICPPLLFGEDSSVSKDEAT